jgi:dienelactone hydrolase
MAAVGLNGPGAEARHRFAAAVAYYPPCGDPDVYAPTLILIGELDDWTPALPCREMMKRRSGRGASMRLVIYPNAYHAFNSARLAGKPETAFGHHLEYNEAAAAAALDEVDMFLAKTIGQ